MRSRARPAEEESETSPGPTSAPAKAARLRDVAALAQVSTATASRALSGEPRISNQTRLRVERAARRLSYTVNPLARALSLQRTSTVGLMVGDLTNPFFAQLARGVDAGLRAEGYAYMLADLAGEVGRQRELVEHLVNRHVDGLIVTVPHDIAVLAASRLPVVAVDRADGLPYVSGDNFEGGRLAGEHLVGSGYRHPALLLADPHLSPVRDRRAGFVEALRAADIAVAAEHRCTSLGYDDAYAGAVELLGHGVDAVFAIDDVMAAAVIAAALELNLRVPEDVGVVGYDDTPMASWRTLSLTTIDQRTTELGRAAAEMVLRCIQDPATEPPSLTLAPRLVVRGSSTGPRPRRAPARRSRPRMPVSR